MLLLEQRFLEPLLPPVVGRDVVDLGCGTGRWLEKLALLKPRSLIGIDSSAHMLARAVGKVRGSATLLREDCEKQPLRSSSADLILCSFLVSYLADLDRFAHEICRIARPNADVFISDLHPQTESTLGWRRGFRVNETHVDLATFTWSLDQLLSAFQRLGMRPAALLEPYFGEPEFGILERAGKFGSRDRFRHHPAIYILQLKHVGSSPHSSPDKSASRALGKISGARVAIGPQESARADICIENGRIEFLGRLDVRPAPTGALPSTAIDLTGHLMLPGLINSHDHLEFALFPKLGKGNYRNFSQWATDVHHPECSPIREHRAVPKATRLWWGGIRNLLAGVTTVCHHNPYQAEVFEDGFPVRVHREFGWAHSLAVDSDVAGKYRDTPPDQAFILHLAEGLDLRTAEEIFSLSRAGALGDKTVIVHGLALDERGWSILKSSDAALIWCPTSNQFLFGKTHTASAIKDASHVALGSDSPLTAQGDLLDELRFACKTVGVPPEDLYSQVTSQAAGILRLRRGQGSIRVGAVADLIAVRDTGLTPADTLAACSYCDIELVVIGGNVQLASSRLFESLPHALTDGLECLDVDGNVRWVRAPVGRLSSEAMAVLGSDLRVGGRKVNHERAL